MKRIVLLPLLLCFALSTFAGQAFCALNVSFGTSPGSDGAFTPSGNTTVDLSSAGAGTWDAAGSGNGVYDASKWAVVFKYSSVTIPYNVTVNFKNHPSNAPVVWLVSGNVEIDGAIDVSGQSSATNGANAIPGPGGFRGGSGNISGRASGSGFGVGGGNTGDSSNYNYGGGSYASVGGASGSGSPGQTYGNPQILPLIGGSGGSGTGNDNGDGGAGGGAILIVATGTITLNGSIYANGGNQNYRSAASGSGGAIRLIAPIVNGSGVLRATPGSGDASGGFGRVRVETSSSTVTLSATPDFSLSAPDSPVMLWPDSTFPTVTVASIGSAAVPADPRASLESAADVQFNTSAAQTVTLTTTNVPAASTVTVRVTPKYGLSFTVTATHVSDNGITGTWTAQVTFPSNYCAVQAHAVLPNYNPTSLALRK